MSPAQLSTQPCPLRHVGGDAPRPSQTPLPGGGADCGRDRSRLRQQLLGPVRLRRPTVHRRESDDSPPLAAVECILAAPWPGHNGRGPAAGEFHARSQLRRRGYGGVELSRDEHPWFLGCQFHPEFKSKPLAPHPLFASFVHAAFRNRLQTETAVEQMPESETLPRDRVVAVSEN